MNNDEKIVKEIIDSLVDTNVELDEIKFAEKLFKIIDNIDDSDKCGYSLNESGCKFLECIFE